MKYIAICTYGNIKYTKLAVASIQRTASSPYEIVLVIGKPDDKATQKLAESLENVHVIQHESNLGFPAALNDVMDYVFKKRRADEFLIMGNDVIPMEGGVDALISAARVSDYDYLSGVEIASRSFLLSYPQYWSYFNPDYSLRDFSFRGYEDFIRDHQPRPTIRPISFINGFHNFAVVKRSYFEKVGYVDVGFYPAYYEDNDYVTRGFKAGCKFAEVTDAHYFHFWSRTIYEAVPNAQHQRYFALNADYYRMKWGGDPGKELHGAPFAGALPYDPHNRKNEANHISYWKWTPKMLQNRHLNQRCVIAGNGPSLNETDLSLLKDEAVVVLNRWYLSKKLHDLNPIYSTMVNGTMLDQWGEEFVGMGVPAFIPPRPELWRPYTYGIQFTAKPGFQSHIDGIYYQGHTVTYVALQLAFALGFRYIILVGLDHAYSSGGEQTGKLAVRRGRDPDHFSSDYFPEGSLWETPNLGGSEKSYAMARQAFEFVGGKIINASVTTKLDVFEKMSLREALSQNAN